MESRCRNHDLATVIGADAGQEVADRGRDWDHGNVVRWFGTGCGLGYDHVHRGCDLGWHHDLESGHVLESDHGVVGWLEGCVVDVDFVGR